MSLLAILQLPQPPRQVLLGVGDFQGTDCTPSRGESQALSTMKAQPCSPGALTSMQHVLLPGVLEDSFHRGSKPAYSRAGNASRL